MSGQVFEKKKGKEKQQKSEIRQMIFCLKKENQFSEEKPFPGQHCIFAGNIFQGANGSTFCQFSYHQKKNVLESER